MMKTHHVNGFLRNDKNKKNLNGNRRYVPKHEPMFEFDDNFKRLEVQLLGANCLAQIAWRKLLGANCLAQIAWRKLLGANCLAQIARNYKTII
jgi:hypothetical protein